MKFRNETKKRLITTNDIFFITPGINNSDEIPGNKNGHTENMHITRSHGSGPKTWTQEDMEMALDALRNHNMSLTKVSYFLFYDYNINCYFNKNTNN